MADNIFDSAATTPAASEPSYPTQQAPQAPTTNMFDSGSSSANMFDAGTQAPPRPFSGQQQPAEQGPTPEHLYQDETKPWYSRAWDWANTPLTETVLGIPEERPGAGGFERGVEHVLSGLTSPLSVALTAATFGTGGLVESAGASALKEAATEAGGRLFAESEIPQMARAAKISLDAFKEQKALEPVIQEAIEAGGHDVGLLQKARQYLSPFNKDAQLGENRVQSYLSKVGLSPEQRAALEEGEMTAAEREAIATKNGGFSDEQLSELAKTGDTIAKAKSEFKPIEDALKAEGIDPDKWAQAQDILRQNGLSEQDLIGRGIIQNGVFQVVRKAVPTLPIKVAARAAKTANTLMNGGFTLQQLQMASQMSPRFLDALKAGDTDKAWEYGTEAAIGAGFGLLGAPHALHSAGELFKPLISTEKFRPNDEWLAIDRANKEREVMHAVAEQHAIDIDNRYHEIMQRPRGGIFGLDEATKAMHAQQDAAIHLWRDVGQGDPVQAARWHDALAEAAGRSERLMPDIGEPLEQEPARVGTKSIFSNKAGEVRVGADGRPVVWLGPEGWRDFNKAVSPEGRITGVSLNPMQGRDAARAVSHNPEVQALIDEAQKASQDNLLTATQTGLPNAVQVVSEELHHTWQRELSQNGEILSHLDGAVYLPDGAVGMEPGSQWDTIHGTIPQGWMQHLENLGYTQPIVQVLETAAKFLAGRQGESSVPVSDEEVASFLKNYLGAVVEKHGGIALKTLKNINEIAKQHVEDINAQREAANKEPRTTHGRPIRRGPEGVSERGRRPAGVGPEQPAGEGEGPRTTPDTRLKSIEVPEEEHNDAYAFVSPNTHNIQNVRDAEFRLGSRPQKLTETLSNDFARELGAKISVRPAMGHWEGGAENSTVQRFPVGTDPDLIEYHNAVMAKAGYQNAGGGFIPGEGTDVLFQFRVPDTAASASDIGSVLEAHHIPGDTIEPVAGGHLVTIGSEGGQLRPQIEEVASNLGVPEVGETNGRLFFHGDYGSRESAQTAFENRIQQLEAKHPEWRQVRQAFESRPDYVGLSRLVRETKQPFVSAVHGTRAAGLETISPEKQFTGPQKGAEQARAKAFPDDFVKRSYWRVEGTHGEPFYERMPYQYRTRLNAENLYPWVQDPEHLLQAAYEEAKQRNIQNQPGAIGTIYERMMKDAGYDGYYHPSGEITTFKDTPVDQEMREGTSPLLGEGRAAAPLYSREKGWDYIKKYLTPEEQAKHDTEEKRNSLVAAFHSLPDAEEWNAAIRAGRAGQMWYERSSRAFDALLDSGFKSLHPEDKEKFLNFVAALSPVQSVRSNLAMALDLWSKWDKAGRPEDAKWGKTWDRNKKGEVVTGMGYNKSSKLYKTVGTGVDLRSRLNNAIRALQGEPMSGPKVSAFTKNLGEDTGRVTNDTWMAVLAGQDPNRINTPAIYNAMSAKVREAAEANGIDPRQAQAAAWSFIKALAELSGWGNDRWIPPQEIIKRGWLTHDLIASHSADFADLLQNDPTIRGLIKKLGGNIDAFDEKLRSYVPERPAKGEASELSDRLLNAAGRLEAARADAKIQRHLEAKSGPQSSFDFGRDTDFNHGYADQYISGGGGGIGAKFVPLYSRERVANPDVQKLAEDYNKDHGIEKPLHEGLAPVNSHLAKKIADAYEEMKHEPNSPKVKKAYSALKSETEKQWDAAEKAGYKFEPWTKEGQPYANSKEMADDVRDNKHLYYFTGGDVPKDHPMSEVDPKTGETYNNMFRAVHDLFGHAKNDYQFGPQGEENAFLAHSRMFSDKALPALLSETKAQNSWVNFGKHLRNAEGNVPIKGEPGYVSPAERPFGEQKAGVLPEDLVREASEPARPETGQPTPLFSREQDNRPPQWYLKSTGLISQRMQGPMPADTVLKMLENNGVKPDELKYTGLSDFLREKGKEPVRPEELKKFLDANNLQIQEVIHGENLPKTPDQLSREEYGLAFNQLQEYQQRRIQSMLESGDWPGNTARAKFGTYALPGGQNYREMLLTLPGANVPDIPRIKELQARLDAATDLNPALRRGTQDEIDRIKRQAVAGQEFRSSHWDEPNVVGHVRFNDRVGPNGEKLLHLEELQSDWHQKGRTQGYVPSHEPRWSVRDKDDGTIIESYATEAEARARAAREPGTQVIPDRTVAKSVGVPDAPFKKTWPELLFKRMIRYAAENGYDGISWTPGEEQAARYDLSKQVGRVTYAPVDGTLRAYDHNGNQILSENSTPEKLPDYIGKEAASKILQTPRVDVDNMKPGDRTTVLRHGKPTEVTINPNRRLDEGTQRESVAVTSTDGKENTWFVPLKTLATHELSGLNLKVGGEGMKGFYDKMVPEMANKLGKQFGAKVGETKIDVAPQHTYPGNGLPFEIQDEHGRPVDGYATRDEAEFELRAWPRGYKIVEAGRMFKPDQKYVPYFPITESLRETVLKQGQPLFSKEAQDKGLPSNIEDMIRTNRFKDLPKEYQDRVLGGFKKIATKSMSERELQAAKYLAEENDKNWELGSANDLLHDYIDNYMHRVYENTNPQGRVILSDAKQGKFATNVNMARHRVYESTLAALLRSPKPIKFDPATITAQDRAFIIKAAANRNLIDTLRDNFTRASDGRPAVVLSGQGHRVSGMHGEDPKTFIDPNRVRKVTVADSVIENLKKTGDFDRFLEDGTLRDITPYVTPGNIGQTIDRLEAMANSKHAQYDEVGNNKLRTQIMYLKSMMGNRDFSGLKELNENLPKKYAWDPQDYISLNHGSLKGWNFVTNDTAGNGILVRSDIRVHPEFAEYLKERLGLEPSGISKNPIGRAALGVGSKLKHTLLSLSPFHMVQIGLRGIMTGVNPFTLNGPDLVHGAKIDPMDPNSPTKLYKMVEHGMTTGTDYRALQEHSEGVSAGGNALKVIPGIGKTVARSLDWYQDFLFKRYIPAIKATAAEHMFDEYRRLHPEWSTDRIARVAAAHANDSFGGINWRAMGRSATTQDWGRLMLLAPDWLESELRSGARLFNKDEGGLGRAQVIKMGMALWGIARVLNLLTTGNAHYEAPFGLAVKNKEGKETIFGIRTLPTDLLHAASDPVGFMKGRLSPTIRTGQELLTQRDYFGRKLSPQDMWVDIFRNMAPIPVQSIGQALTGAGPEVGNVGQVVKAVGGTARTYRTPAEELGAELASNHNEDGPIDRASMARHRRIIDLEDQLRTGQVTWPDLVKLTYQTDQLKESELKKIQQNYKNTKDLPPEMASLYARASRLPAAEYLQLYDVMNPAEKASLARLTLQVQKRYLMKAKKDETPEERQRDPVFQRFMRMIPGQAAPSQNPNPGITKGSETMVVPSPKGLVEPGNLPIWNRPVVHNDDGTVSTEYSVSFQDDKGREVLVPTVVHGRFLTPTGKKPPEGSPEEKAMFRRAWDHYIQTGENLGKFDNPEDADAYAQLLHSRG